MLGENKNLKVTPETSVQYETETNLSDRQGSHSMSYTKTNKLITALYMVTDIIDKEEPLRNKLRMLGSDVISDTCTISTSSHMSKQTTNKISEILSFLDIASAVGMISEMNCKILKKEFIELKQSLQENYGQGLSLSELFQDSSHVALPLVEAKEEVKKENKVENKNVVKENSPTRIGVQKGSTLLGALNRFQMSDSRVTMSNKTPNPVKIKTARLIGENDFDVLKKKRREEIIEIVKRNKEANPASGGATITDIRSKAKGVLVSCGEKTLQRELVSMVKDTVLQKTGEKRWSKYFI